MTITFAIPGQAFGEIEGSGLAQGQWTETQADRDAYAALESAVVRKRGRGHRYVMTATLPDPRTRPPDDPRLDRPDGPPRETFRR